MVFDANSMGTQIDSLRDLATTVHARRSDLGLSQEELAARMGVSRQWISAFERGRPRAELGLVIRLLHALDLRFELVERDSDRRSPARASVDLDALLEEYRPTGGGAGSESGSGAGSASRSGRVRRGGSESGRGRGA
jgi:HTH-type transcriptional regulator/antitoxin HipB